MRVNHTGEVCAQALYQGQAMMARSPDTREKLLGAAQEEADHLAWCETRLQELDAQPSKLNPLFYAASFALGAATAMVGDKVSLGFVTLPRSVSRIIWLNGPCRAGSKIQLILSRC